MTKLERPMSDFLVIGPVSEFQMTYIDNLIIKHLDKSPCFASYAYIYQKETGDCYWCGGKAGY